MYEYHTRELQCPQPRSGSYAKQSMHCINKLQGIILALRATGNGNEDACPNTRNKNANVNVNYAFERRGRITRDGIGAFGRPAPAFRFLAARATLVTVDETSKESVDAANS